jgi:hypothetical protein
VKLGQFRQRLLAADGGPAYAAGWFPLAGSCITNRCQARPSAVGLFSFRPSAC